MATLINTSSLSTSFQGYFNKQLLKYAVQSLRLNEFAQMADLPKNVGATTVSFFRFGAGASSNVQTLVEGTTPTTTRTVSLTKITATLVQYGELAEITDIMGATQLFDALSQAITTMGEDAALNADDLSRNELVTNGTVRYAQSTGNFAGLAGAGASSGKFIALDLLDMNTRLKINRAPAIRNGGYVLIVPPQISRDVMNDPDWRDASKYAGSTQIFKGEMGTLFGTAILEATNPFIEDSGGSEGTNIAAGDIFSSFLLGQNAFGVAKLSGDSPLAPRVIITKGSDKADPLDQLTMAGWKSFNTSKLLNANFCRVYKSKSGFNGTQNA